MIDHGVLAIGVSVPPTIVDGQQAMSFQGAGNVTIGVQSDQRGLTRWEMSFVGPHNGVVQSAEWLVGSVFFLSGAYSYTTSVDFANGDREIQTGTFTIP